MTLCCFGRWSIQREINVGAWSQVLFIHGEVKISVLYRKLKSRKRWDCCIVSKGCSLPRLWKKLFRLPFAWSLSMWVGIKCHSVEIRLLFYASYITEQVCCWRSSYLFHTTGDEKDKMILCQRAGMSRFHIFLISFSCCLGWGVWEHISEYKSRTQR